MRSSVLAARPARPSFAHDKLASDEAISERAIEAVSSTKRLLSTRFRQIKGSGTPANALSYARTQAACGTRHGERRLAPPSACGRARLPAFHLRFSPAGLSSRGLSVGPGFPKTVRKLRRAARTVSGHSDAPRAPVVVPAGMMPEPPGCGPYLSARGRRTRSAFRKYPSEGVLLSERDQRPLLSSPRQSQSALNFRR